MTDRTNESPNGEGRHGVAALDLVRWAALSASVGDRVLGPLEGSLADRVARTSRIYTRDRHDLEPASDREALQARLRFYLVRDLPKLVGPVRELALAEALPPRDRPWRVLDLGAGCGTTTFSFLAGAAAAGRSPVAVRVDAVDRDGLALKCMEGLATRAGEVGLPPITVRAHEGDARRPPERGPWDVVLLGLFLNELAFDAQRSLLAELAGALAPGGTLIALEPALRDTARSLHRLRDALEPGWTIFAPCVRRGPCPMLLSERDWCHEEERLVLPPALEAVARGAGLRGDRLRYAYLTLRRDGRTLADVVGASSWRVVSQPLPSKGKLELYGCSEVGRVRLVRLNRHQAEPNEAFGEGRRGQVLELEGAEPKGQGLRIVASTRVRRRR